MNIGSSFFTGSLLLLLAAGCATPDTPVTKSALPVSSAAEKTYPELDSLRAMAEQGDPQAQFVMGNRYERGQGAPQSYAEAFNWYRKSAEQGHAAAQFYLGAMYASGRGTAHDVDAAVMWYQKSAAQNYRDAMYPVAYAYEFGISVARDYSASLQWYQRSAEAGGWHAMDRLGKAYQAGELGLTPDAEKARAWLDKAAASGAEKTFTVPIGR